MEKRNVYDCIHDLISFDSFYWKIIDTPQFQRTRELHQLGSSYFVFPSANHSRFEHSLGTGYKCQDFIEQLKVSNPEEDITPEITRGVVIAGLCHNIGHGPFSYPFTDFVHENLGDKEWSHIDTSIMLLDQIINENAIDLSTEEVNFIKDLMTGERKFSLYSEKLPNWPLQILHNKTNGVDIDKFDFLKRDTYKLGLSGHSFDSEILLKSARIINDNICYRSQDAYSIYELFQCRYRIFKEFYLHRVSKGIDLMIKDIFQEANLVYDFKSYLYNPTNYIKLKDTILNQILYSKKEGLSSAQKLVKRIYQRDLYKFVGEKTCFASSAHYEKFINLTEDDILNSSTSDGLYKEEMLVPGDVKIMKCKLDFCKGEEDPIKYVTFYEKKKGKIQISNKERTDISLITPNNFSEMIFRVYVTNPSKLSAAKSAFQNFCEISGEAPHQYEKKSATKFDR